MAKRKASETRTQLVARECRPRLMECLRKEPITLGDWALSRAQSDVNIIYDPEGFDVSFLGHWSILVQKSSFFEDIYREHIEGAAHPATTVRILLSDDPSVSDANDSDVDDAGPNEIVVRIPNDTVFEIQDAAIFKTVLDYIYWNEQIPFFKLFDRFDSPRIADSETLLFCVQMWIHANTFGVRGLEDDLWHKLHSYQIHDLAFKHAPGVMPPELYTAITLYYSRNPAVGSVLGEEFTRSLLSIGHSDDGPTTDSKILSDLVIEFPALGADIARHYLNIGITYPQRIKALQDRHFRK